MEALHSPGQALQENLLTWGRDLPPRRWPCPLAETLPGNSPLPPDSKEYSISVAALPKTPPWGFERPHGYILFPCPFPESGDGNLKTPCRESASRAGPTLLLLTWTFWTHIDGGWMGMPTLNAILVLAGRLHRLGVLAGWCPTSKPQVLAKIFPLPILPGLDICREGTMAKRYISVTPG